MEGVCRKNVSFQRVPYLAPIPTKIKHRYHALALPCTLTEAHTAYPRASHIVLIGLAIILASAQRVPEPDPLPGISFDTRPDSVLEIIG